MHRGLVILILYKLHVRVQSQKDDENFLNNIRIFRKCDISAKVLSLITGRRDCSKHSSHV